LGILSLGAFAQDLSRESKMEEILASLANKENNNPFGVLEFLHWNHPWNNYKYPDRRSLEKVSALMQEAGVGWVRTDFLWEDIEPSKGVFKFTKYDTIVDVVDRHNIKILGVLHYSTGWASSCGKWNCPPQDTRLFINYVKKVISRYKDKVKYWEIWNEPDSSTYWNPQDGLKSYCAFLKEVYLAAKKIDPDCKILNGGLAGGLSSVNKLYDSGAKGYFDILNLHSFENPLHAAALNRVVAYAKLAHKIMAANGDGGKKIWFSEIGCPGVKSVDKVANWWLGKNPDEAQQAGWVKKVYTQLLKNKDVQKVFWAFFRDCSGHWESGVDYFGLLRWDYSRKPSFIAYQECSRKK